MITVAGEALIDLIVDPARHVDPRTGGGPSNVTRAVVRPGLPVAFPGRLSGDRFGQPMRADLERHHLTVAAGTPAESPATLTLLDMDPAGVPAYHFYLAGTSGAALGPGEAVLPDGTAGWP
jgi:fructokinase